MNDDTQALLRFRQTENSLPRRCQAVLLAKTRDITHLKMGCLDYEDGIPYWFINTGKTAIGKFNYWAYINDDAWNDIFNHNTERIVFE